MPHETRPFHFKLFPRQSGSVTFLQSIQINISFLHRQMNAKHQNVDKVYKQKMVCEIDLISIISIIFWTQRISGICWLEVTDRSQQNRCSKILLFSDELNIVVAWSCQLYGCLWTLLSPLGFFCSVVCPVQAPSSTTAGACTVFFLKKRLHLLFNIIGSFSDWLF